MELLSIIAVLISLASFCAARFRAKVHDGVPAACSDVINLQPFIRIGHGYYVVENKNELDWFDAAHYCRRLGADLVSIESEEELDALVTYIDIHGYTSALGIWLSANDLEEDGTFIWSGNGKPMNFTPWAPGQPNRRNNFYNCVLLFNDDREFLVNDCEASANFICEANDLQLVSLAVW